jgi:hypothetical protein
MSLESSIATALNNLAGGRIYPDTLPDSPAFPAVTYQQVGGQSLWFGGRDAMPGYKHARVQFNCWAKTRLEASNLARAIENRLGTHKSGLKVNPVGAAVALYQDQLKLYGTRQDFSIWYPDP